MIHSRIQIENGAIEDFYTKWGFIYMEGDHRFAAPEKPRDTTSYAEEAGEHTDPRTVDDAFDYSAKFLIDTPNSNDINANSKIRAWNEAVRERTAGSDIKRCKTVTFYDDYKRVKVVGIPEIAAEVEATDYYRRKGMDCIVFTLKIHVSEPGKCDFDMSL